MNKQTILFVIVGGIGFVIDAGGVFLLNHMFDLSPILLRIGPFSLAIITTFIFHYFFTFKNDNGWFQSYMKYLSTISVAQGTNFSIYWGLVTFIPFFQKQPFYAVAIGSLSVMFLSFILCKYWAFKDNPKK